jgi:hypothetical protein
METVLRAVQALSALLASPIALFSRRGNPVAKYVEGGVPRKSPEI